MTSTATATSVPTQSEVTFEELDLDTLEVTASWQKERFDPKFAARIAANLREPLIGVLSVAIDPAGKRQVWDGQHRLHALKLAGYSKWMCMVTHADNREQAELFVSQANRKSLTGSNKHAANVFVDPAARDIDGIVRNHGYVLTPGFPNTIRAVSTIYRIYYRAGAGTLDRTINISKRAWPEDKAGRGDIILDGIATFLQAYSDVAVDQEVINILSTITDPAAYLAAGVRMCPTIKDKGGARNAKKFESFAMYLAKEYGRRNNMKLHQKRIVEINRSYTAGVKAAAALVPEVQVPTPV